MARTQRIEGRGQPVGAIEKLGHGQADETPVLALTGVVIVVGLVVLVVLGLSLLLYYLA